MVSTGGNTCPLALGIGWEVLKGKGLKLKFTHLYSLETPSQLTKSLNLVTPQGSW